MNASRAIVGLTAAAFIGFGIAFTFWPESMAAFTEIGLPTATARIDFAATYGGFEIGFGAFLLLGFRRPEWLESALWAGVLSLGGFAAVRLVTLTLSSAPVRTPIYVALVLELGGVLLNVLGLRRIRRRSGSSG